MNSGALARARESLFRTTCGREGSRRNAETCLNPCRPTFRVISPACSVFGLGAQDPAGYFWYVPLFLARVPIKGSRSRRLCSSGGSLIRSWRLGPDMDIPASEPPLSSRLGVERLLCVEPPLREVRPKSRVGMPLDLPASRCCLSYRLRTSACHPVVW